MYADDFTQHRRNRRYDPSRPIEPESPHCKVVAVYDGDHDEPPYMPPAVHIKPKKSWVSEGT